MSNVAHFLFCWRPIVKIILLEKLFIHFQHNSLLSLVLVATLSTIKNIPEASSVDLFVYIFEITYFCNRNTKVIHLQYGTGEGISKEAKEINDSDADTSVAVNVKKSPLPRVYLGIKIGIRY